MGGPDSKYELEIRVSLHEVNRGGNGLDVSERLEIGGMEFMELAAVLGEFHNLAKQIKARQGVK